MNKKIFCYLDTNNGNDSNDGLNKNTAFKSFNKAKQYIYDKDNDGVIYIIGKNIIPDNDFVLEKNINLMGINKDSEIIYHSNFGDDICKMKNISFYKLKVTYGDKRWNYHPYMYGDFYNCIVTMSGSLAYDYCNFYNCLFNTIGSDIGYRSSETFYHVKGIYINCIFNEKNYNNSTSLRNVINNPYNIVVKDEEINNCYNKKISLLNPLLVNKGDPTIPNNNIGLFGGYASYVFDEYKFLIKNEDQYYTLNNNELKELKDFQNTAEYFKKNGFDDIGNLKNTILQNSNFKNVKILLYSKQKDITRPEITINLETPFRTIDNFKNKINILKMEKDNLNKSQINITGLKKDTELIVASGDINKSIAKNIDFFDLEAIEENGKIFIAVSNDKGKTWLSTNNYGLNWNDLNVDIPLKNYDTFSQEELQKWTLAAKTIKENGISLEKIKNIDFNKLSNSTIRFAYVLYRPTYESKANCDKLSWQFDAKGSMVKMKDSEYDLELTEDKIIITPKIDTSILKINTLSDLECNNSDFNSKEIKDLKQAVDELTKKFNNMDSLPIVNLTRGE